jgi:hypothetical protein
MQCGAARGIGRSAIPSCYNLLRPAEKSAQSLRKAHLLRQHFAYRKMSELSSAQTFPNYAQSLRTAHSGPGYSCRLKNLLHGASAEQCNNRLNRKTASTTARQ